MLGPGGHRSARTANLRRSLNSESSTGMTRPQARTTVISGASTASSGRCPVIQTFNPLRTIAGLGNEAFIVHPALLYICTDRYAIVETSRLSTNICIDEYANV